MKKFTCKIFVIFCLFFTGCRKDFLDVPSRDAIFRQAYIKDLTTTGEFLNGIYFKLGTGFYTGTAILYPELIADNIKTISFAMASQYNWNQIPNDEKSISLTFVGNNTNGLWLTGYGITRDCSFVLETVDAYRAEDLIKADQYKGQAIGIRALAHFLLVNTYAQSYNFTADASHVGIPYINSSDWRQKIARNTVKEVYDQIITDLTAAIPLLPTVTPKPVYFNREAAKALLARVYLFKGDYNRAKELATEVATAIPITVTADYGSQLFTPLESEALFQLPPASFGINGATNSTLFAGVLFTNPLYFFAATEDIALLLQESATDVRRNWVTSDGTNWSITKYPANVDPDFSLPAGAYYQTILRSSEMYLTAAEAYAQLNNVDSAIYYLDAIRMRADPMAGPTLAGGGVLLDSIYKERRKELAFEGLRMFDLLRWKKGVTRIDGPSSANSLPYPSPKAISPIPESDVSLNGFQQNESY